jgi:predicted Zn finger-like uncharacterized protein
MSLATRCTACGTVFRVVQDQLKVSEGWVRCGRCNEVFNALEGLFDLDRDVPPEFIPQTVSPSVSAFAEYRDAGDSIRGTDAVEKIDAQLLGPRDSDNMSTPATRINERDRLEFPDAQFDPDLFAEDTIEPALVFAASPTEESERAAATAPAPLDRVVAPEFVRRAQRRASWHRPWVRAALGTFALLLVIGFGLQGMHHFRDVIAARWPDAKPVLQAWCALAACVIEAPRRIDEVSVESSSLTRAPTPDAFKLSLALRNKGSVVVAMPSIDLTLSDTTGQLVARRVLHPRDFNVAATTLPPSGEQTLQLVLNAGNSRVVGYTVEIFYP